MISPAHLFVVVLKLAQFETLLQFGPVPQPELIKRALCFIQLRQQSDPGSATDSQAQKQREMY